jgi:hypothetical protein
MTDYRVKVRRDGAERPWRAWVITPPGETLGNVDVGEFDTMPEAVTRGVTALRFVTAGIPWRQP